MILYHNTQTDRELQQILTLQLQNTTSSLTSEEQQDQGFVTVVHSLPLLQKMAIPYGHTVATDAGRLIGYALVMLPALRDDIEVLRPMFARLDQLVYEGQPVSGYPFFVMGQVCVAYDYRGKGVFAGLYQQLRSTMRSRFDLIVTEVASRNRRSLRAHQKAGFLLLDTYGADAGEEWNILVWNIR